VWGRAPREPALSEVEGSKPSVARQLLASKTNLDSLWRPPERPMRKSAPRHCRPLNLSLASGTVSMLSRPPTFLFLTRNLRNCCIVCATKGGVWTTTPICGVLLLDPSLYSPLEWVKSVVTILIHGTASHDATSEEPCELTAEVNLQILVICSALQPAQTESADSGVRPRRSHFAQT